MRPSKSCNLVQDVTTDCSVVASLSAAIGMLTGKHAVSIHNNIRVAMLLKT